ncbi:response regulator [Pleomorphovibrio marinus]|uniref:response regulator n=1 Tax=Pleomorphovibrio marinus TaxID=2164132 RepID=UPI000E0B7DAC|nr:response regulator [Pleomorphovibrio marinus]
MNQSKIHVLLADDDEDDRLFFRDAINQLNLKTIVHTVEDGEELMVWLRDEGNPQPHVVFLDLNMPKKGGIECLEEIKSCPKLKDLSVAIYSTSSSQKDIEDSFVLGANIYIKKPNDFNELKKALSKVISMNWQFCTSGLNKESFILNV